MVCRRIRLIALVISSASSAAVSDGVVVIGGVSSAVVRPRVSAGRSPALKVLSQAHYVRYSATE